MIRVRQPSTKATATDATPDHDAPYRHRVLNPLKRREPQRTGRQPRLVTLEQPRVWCTSNRARR